MKSTLFSTSLFLVLCLVSACGSRTETTDSTNATNVSMSIPNDAVLAQVSFDSPVSRNADRMYEMETYAISIQEYFMTQDRKFPAGITTVPQRICKYKTPCTGVNLDILVDNGFMKELPFDESSPTNDTGYTIRLHNNRTQLTAPFAEGGIELRTR